MKKIDISFCSTLEDAVNELLRRRANGEHVYCIFNEVKLYSDTTILTLLQISMALFASQYLLLGLSIASHKFKKYDKNYNKLEISNNENVNTFSSKNIRIVKILDFGDRND